MFLNYFLVQSWTNCVNAQADLRPCCSHITKTGFINQINRSYLCRIRKKTSVAFIVMAAELTHSRMLYWRNNLMRLSE